MSNLVAFNSVFERAMRVEEHRVSYDEALRIQVPTQVIIFAKSHIDLLEEQLDKVRKEFAEYRKEFEDMSGDSTPSVDLYGEGIKAARQQAEYGDGQ